MTTLAQYDRARAALAEATRVDQILPIIDEVEHIKLYARQIRDQALLADASEFQMRAERRLGFVIAEAKKGGHFVQHRPKTKKDNGNSDEPLSVTLEDVGVTKRLSATAQQRSTISEQAFENAVAGMRQRIAAGKSKIIEASMPSGSRSIAPGRIEPDDSLDFFPTPPWATRALIHHPLRVLGITKPLGKVWEPACGEGHIAEVLAEFALEVVATDIHDYGYGEKANFLAQEPLRIDADWIITNPPFKDKTEAFVLRALDLAKVGVAMFVRMQWLETKGRYERIFKPHPPTIVSFFSERVPLCKGEWKPDGDTLTAYIWLVWLKDRAPQAPFWIPPDCRDTLCLPDDAARFTTQPVTKKSSLPPHDPETGEVIDPPADGFVLGGTPFYKCECFDDECIINGCKKGRTLDSKTGEIIEHGAGCESSGAARARARRFLSPPAPGECGLACSRWRRQHSGFPATKSDGQSRMSKQRHTRRLLPRRPKLVESQAMSSPLNRMMALPVNARPENKPVARDVAKQRKSR